MAWFGLMARLSRSPFSMAGMRAGVIKMFEEAGQSERMLFGTELPWFSPIAGLGCLLSADITDDDRHNIYHRNAERLLERFERIA